MDIQGRPRMSRELLRRLSRSNTPDDVPLGRAVDSSSDVSMDVRRNLYRNSHLGSRQPVRRVGGEMGKPVRRPDRGDPAVVEPKKIDSSQNRPSAGFSEPSVRKYNRYK